MKQDGIDDREIKCSCGNDGCPLGFSFPEVNSENMALIRVYTKIPVSEKIPDCFHEIVVKLDIHSIDDMMEYLREYKKEMLRKRKK
jgi:hypothetical protein